MLLLLPDCEALELKLASQVAPILVDRSPPLLSISPGLALAKVTFQYFSIPASEYTESRAARASNQASKSTPYLRHCHDRSSAGRGEPHGALHIRGDFSVVTGRSKRAVESLLRQVQSTSLRKTQALNALVLPERGLTRPHACCQP